MARGVDAVGGCGGEMTQRREEANPPWAQGESRVEFGHRSFGSQIVLVARVPSSDLVRVAVKVSGSEGSRRLVPPVQKPSVVVPKEETYAIDRPRLKQQTETSPSFGEPG